jgi:ribosomal protein L11 methyltransferase
MSVDWEQQWSLFAPNFRDGKAHIDLGGPILRLIPGAGFGDLSHPTTQMMIELLKKHSAGHSIVDIGTGSGILSLAALLLGSPTALGLDIDLEALAHARENARLNGLQERFSAALSLPKSLPQSIFLMNMILPEQKEISPAKWNRFAKLWIVSGILVEQREQYLELAKLWKWTPLEEVRKGEWAGWIFSC